MNPQKKPKSRQEILKQQQQSTFVGREEHIVAFRYNLVLPPADWCFLFNVWGQGGVGKSTLLRQFRRLAEEVGFLTAYTNDSDNNVLQVMGRIAEQLEQQGYRLNQFAERYKVYLQKKQELEADPDAPQGFSAFLGKSIAKASLGLAKQVPGSGAITPFLDEEAIANQAGDWASYVAKKIGNKDEVHLMQKPTEVLTPLFLQDLSKVTNQKNVLLLLDTYERTEGFLDNWLRDILEGCYGDLPINIILVIAGREELERNHWADYQGAISRITLKPFTEEEAKQYLNRKGITNPHVIDVILRLSGRLPLLVATLAAESPTDPAQIGDPSGTAVERFLQWVNDPKHRQVALDAALPRTLNRDVIAVLHGEGSADELFNWLIQMPFVEQRSDGWMYHDIARTQMLRHKRLVSPQSWVDLHGKLADWYSTRQANLKLEVENQWQVQPWSNLTPDYRQELPWQRLALGTLYHRLCQMPYQDLKSIWSEFLVSISKQTNFAQQWADVVEQVGRDVEIIEIATWGKLLSEGLKADEREEYGVAIEQFTNLLALPGVQANWKPVVLLLRGLAHFFVGHDAIAFEDVDEAIRLDPKYAWAYASRGMMHRSMRQYADSLRDLNHAIDLDPSHAEAISRRGVTYVMMEQYENALKDFSRAAELDPMATWITNNLGNTYRLLNRYHDAFRSYSRVLALDPNYYPAVYSRGRTCLTLKLYQEALEDFNRLIKLQPGEAFCFGSRALAYFALNQLDNAKADLTRAIDLAQEDYSDNPENHRNTLNLASYHLIANNIEQAKHFYSDALRRGASQARIQAAVQDLEDLLKVFPSHATAQQIREALLKRIGDS